MPTKKHRIDTEFFYVSKEMSSLDGHQILFLKAIK